MPLVCPDCDHDIDHHGDEGYGCLGPHSTGYGCECIRTREDVARRLLAQLSDGYHTMAELYEYRLLYHAHAAIGWHAAGIPVVKSRRHSDGTTPFDGGWFIVVAQLSTGQVSNHYELDNWDLFDIPEADLPPAYDGHTPHDAAQRLRDALEGQR